MIVYPHAKINLGLRIKGKRGDGFHEIETVIYPVEELCDILEIKPSQAPQLSLYGLSVGGALEDNLCMKAYNMLQVDFGLPPVQLHLCKQIPVGSGLGGGSSDGAYTLRLLNDYFSLGMNELDLEKYAARLGSDCPAMLYKRPALATGRGEQISPIPLDLSGFHIAVYKPDFFISTAQAYAMAEAHRTTSSRCESLGTTPLHCESLGTTSSQQARSTPQHPCSLHEALSQPISTWKECVVNDFEAVLFLEYPILKKYKEELYASGAVYASLSGSGSALYGIFDSKEQSKRAIKSLC